MKNKEARRIMKLEFHTIPADAEIGNADYLANQQRDIYDSR